MLSGNRGGFMLIEAILAIGLIAFATTMKIQNDQVNNEIEKSKVLGGDIAKIPYAIDKKVLLDGVQKEGGWNKSWDSSASVINGLFKKEMIGKDNSSCAGTWDPVAPENSSIGLLPCNFMEIIPFNMNVKAKAEGGSDNEIKNFSVYFYHPNKESFDKHFHLYPSIVNSANLRTSPQVTGTHTYSIVDIRNGGNISLKKCSDIGEDCAIQAKYSTNNMGLGEDSYLRTNGLNMMHASIGFSSGDSDGSRAKCTKVDSAGSSEEVNCGINLNLKEGGNEVSSSVEKSYASEFLLSNSYLTDGALVDVKCKDKNGNLGSCGISVVKSGASALTSMKVNVAKVDDLEVYESIKSFDISGNESFSVESSTGNIETKGNIKALGGIHASGDINSESNITASNNITASGNVLAGENVEALGDVIAGRDVVTSGKVSVGNTTENSIVTRGGIKVDKGVFVGGSLRANHGVSAGSVNSRTTVTARNNITTDSYLHVKGTAIEGRSCGLSNLGMIGRDSDGKLLSCQQGVWKKLGGGRPENQQELLDSLAGRSASCTVYTGSRNGSATYTARVTNDGVMQHKYTGGGASIGYRNGYDWVGYRGNNYGSERLKLKVTLYGIWGEVDGVPGKRNCKGYWNF